MSIGRPIPEIRLFQTLTLKLQGQSYGCDQRAKSYCQPSILLIYFLFISHQSDQQSLGYSYFEIWPWNIQGQGHESGQRSRSHIIPSIQLMHSLFVSHQSFLTNHSWDMAKIVFDPEKTHPNFKRKFAKITVSTELLPKSNKVITMTRAINLPCFVVIEWVVLTLWCRQTNFC